MEGERGGQVLKPPRYGLHKGLPLGGIFHNASCRTSIYISGHLENIALCASNIFKSNLYTVCVKLLYKVMLFKKSKIHCLAKKKVVISI